MILSLKPLTLTSRLPTGIKRNRRSWWLNAKTGSTFRPFRKEKDMKARLIQIALIGFAGIFVLPPAWAGPNDFFGSNIGGGQESGQGAASAFESKNTSGVVPQTSPPAGDYSDDEKRMQKKYKSNVRSAKNLIAKGQAMMKSKNVKESKKGRILKEIGEKRLA